MAREFQPSSKSLPSGSQAVTRLHYLCRAAAIVETHVDAEGELPPWVLDRITQAAQLMGMAVSYVSFAEEKKFKSSETQPGSELIPVEKPKKVKRNKKT